MHWSFLAKIYLKSLLILYMKFSSFVLNGGMIIEGRNLKFKLNIVCILHFYFAMLQPDN